MRFGPLALTSVLIPVGLSTRGSIDNDLKLFNLPRIGGSVKALITSQQGLNIGTSDMSILSMFQSPDQNKFGIARTISTENGLTKDPLYSSFHNGFNIIDAKSFPTDYLSKSINSLKTVCVIGPLSQSKTMAKKSLYNAL